MAAPGVSNLDMYLKQLQMIFENDAPEYFERDFARWEHDNIWNEGEINFIKDGDQEDPFTLFISEKENLDFLISWKMDGANIEYITKRKLKHDYLLVNRGFHWINEIPFNR